MSDPVRTTASPAHLRHDLSIVAALVASAEDLDEADAATGRAQVASCTACADALADLLALQTTLPDTATPRRSRDFRLTPADARRLHRSGWRRVLGYFGSPRDGFSRPLAIGLTTLGLAGVLLASLPSAVLMGGSAGAAPANEVARQQAAPAPAVSAAMPAPAGGGAPVAAPSGSATDRTSLEAAGLTSAAASASTDSQVFSGSTPDEVGVDTAGDGDTIPGDDTTGVPLLLLVGGALLIAGVGLFALRWSARRLS